MFETCFHENKRERDSIISVTLFFNVLIVKKVSGQNQINKINDIRRRTLTDSERKMNRSEVSSKWNKCRIYVVDQLDRWNELKEVLRVQTRAEVAKILLDR
jgi:hypothetical protein